VLNWRKVNDWIVLSLTGELEMGNSSTLKDEVVEQFISKGQVNIALDFSGLEYIDSSGLGVVVSLHKRCKQNGGRLAIFNMNETLYRLFKLTSLEKALNIYPDEQSFLAKG